MAKKKQTLPVCHCGSGLTRADCCGQFLDGHAYTPTAEALMRSRYSAFCEANRDYLLATWHPETRSENLTCAPAQRWLGLRIYDAIAGGKNDAQGQVEFIARTRIGGGSAQRHHERSYFVRVDDRWYYLNGEII
ncbi:MAG TPA: hypothetical protein ENM98_01045 [Halothiobacillaceae bacterium]|nr:hypothetical protein [Halothiobacillaceae bacterium]